MVFDSIRLDSFHQKTSPLINFLFAVTRKAVLVRRAIQGGILITKQSLILSISLRSEWTPFCTEWGLKIHSLQRHSPQTALGQFLRTSRLESADSGKLQLHVVLTWKIGKNSYFQHLTVVLHFVIEAWCDTLEEVCTGAKHWVKRTSRKG